MRRLYLFGAPRIEHNGQSVALRRTKALALLAYLAISGQPQERDTLLNLLWPEFDDASARNNLRRELSLLRSLLGDDLLDTDRQQIGLNMQADVWSDVGAFLAHLAAAQQLPPATAAWAAALQNAVTLAGDEFLAGFGIPESVRFEEWQFFQREQLRQQLAAALIALLTWHRDAADYQTAIGYARQWLALDALHEPAQRELIRLYALAGQHTAALRQYEVCAQLLANELDTLPEPETLELYTAIKARQIVAPPTASVPAGAVLASPHQPIIELPLPAGGFIGREREIDVISGLLRNPRCRLITLTGPGGVGKTQLALQCAQRLSADPHATKAFADAMVFIPLATITAPELVLPGIMQALKITDQRDQTPLAVLAAFLGQRRCLLILDNLEQVIAVAPEIGALLAAAPQLTLLITSREALRLRDEQIVPVEPLALPYANSACGLQTVLAAPAVRLFVRRAQQIRPDFALNEANLAAISAICQRLDGLPLAIELAAARTRMFSPQALCERLERRLPLLVSNARDSLERHRTLSNAIAWSYDLLDPAEQRLFRRLAIFVGGATLEAIEAICLDQADAGELHLVDLLEPLLAKSLLIKEEYDGEVRVTMLATIQEYAETLLAEHAERAELEARHAQHFAAWAERAHTELYGADQGYWGMRMLQEYNNLRAVMQRALHGGDHPLLLRLAGTLGRFWGLHGYLREGREWLETALAHAAEQNAAPRARALLSLGSVCWMQSDLASAQTGFGASLALYRALGDQYGTAQALNGMGITLVAGAEYAPAHTYLAESLAIFRTLQAPERVATLLNNLAIVVDECGDPAQARALYQESLTLQEDLGNLAGVGLVLSNLGMIESSLGRMAEARDFLERSITLNRKLANLTVLSSALASLGIVNVAQGDYPTAQLQLQEALDLGEQLGSVRSIVDAVEGWAFLAAHTGWVDHAIQLFAAAMHLREQRQYIQGVDDAPVATLREQLQHECAPDRWMQNWQLGTMSEWQLLVKVLRSTLTSELELVAHAEQE